VTPSLHISALHNPLDVSKKTPFLPDVLFVPVVLHVHVNMINVGNGPRSRDVEPRQSVRTNVMFFLIDGDNNTKVVITTNRSGGFPRVSGVPDLICTSFFLGYWSFKPSKNSIFWVVMQYLKKIFVCDYHGCELPSTRPYVKDL